MDNHHIDDLLPGFALGSLDEEEHREVLHHLTGCPRCQRELLAYQEVVEHLPYGVKEYEPSPGLRNAILDKVTTGVTSPPPEPNAPWWSGLAKFFQQNALTWGLASFAIILLLGTTTLLLWSQFQNQIRPNSMQVYVLKSTLQNAEGEAVLVLDSDGDEGNLTVDGLPQLPEDQQYQLWLNDGNNRTDAGVFSVNEEGYGKLHIDLPKGLSAYTGFGITIEPAGGSPAPTGEKVLGLDL